MRETTVEARVFDNHIVRTVHHSFGGGESFTRYVIVPNLLLERQAHWCKENGYDHQDPLGLLPETGIDEAALLIPARYGGPGRLFVNEPFVRSESKRFTVFCQSGGLDI